MELTGFGIFFVVCLVLDVLLTCFNIWWTKKHETDFEGISARLAICICFVIAIPIVNVVVLIGHLLYIWLEVLPKINVVPPNKK